MFNWLPHFFCKQNLLLFVQLRWQPRTYLSAITVTNISHFYLQDGGKDQLAGLDMEQK